MAQGRNNASVAAALGLSERAVEKHINSVFSKLGLSEEPDVHRRVKAVLLYLADRPAVILGSDQEADRTPVRGVRTLGAVVARWENGRDARPGARPHRRRSSPVP